MILDQGVNGVMAQLNNEDIIIAISVFCLVVVLGMHFRRQRRRGQNHLAEHRKAAQYLNPDAELVEDSRPHVRRARWAIILSSLAIAMLLFIGIMSARQ